MAAFLTSLRQRPGHEPNKTLPSKILSSSSRGLKALELGSGCGIAGIAFAQLWPQCQIFLTDLAEAMDVLELNISKAIPAANTTLSQVVLDWEEKLPLVLRDVTLDIILISDCTYNSDSLPALVETLSAMAAFSPHVLVLISLKVRHCSEAILFKLLSTAGFHELSHSSFALPHYDRVSTSDHSHEIIEIYEYQRVL